MVYLVVFESCTGTILNNLPWKNTTLVDLRGELLGVCELLGDDIPYHNGSTLFKGDSIIFTASDNQRNVFVGVYITETSDKGRLRISH